ncbi:MAG: hypothetical protein QXS42_01630 [Zestosphaera sp.]
MLLSSADGVKCPRCGSRITYYGEAELANGHKLARYIIKCKSCGYRDVIQEVKITKASEGVTITVYKPPKVRDSGRVVQPAGRRQGT